MKASRHLESFDGSKKTQSSPLRLLAALVRPPATAMGVGLPSLALYAGLDGSWLLRGAPVALVVLVAAAGAALLRRRDRVGGARAGALVALLSIVVAPGLSPEAVAVPMALGLVAALPPERP